MTVCIQKPSVDLVNQTAPKKSTVNCTKDGYTLVAIDPRVDNWDVLIAGVNPNSKTILLDHRRDSIEQINELIQTYPNVHSLHLISHGTPGNLQLGSDSLNIEALDRYLDVLKSWSNYFGNASIYIYGCQVAQGIQGQNFVQKLHELTNANIAASTKIIGNCDRSRNWQFDYYLGDINPELAFTSTTLARYSGTFEPIVSFSTTPETLIETEGTLFNFNFELSDAPPEGGLVVSIDGNVPESLSQLDLFAIDVQGGDSLEGDFDFSGFSINITEQNATVSVPVFLDDDTSDAIVNDNNPLTPDDFDVTYSL
ncbi:MAG: DUF4347 domain-containing protein, partial [Pleurocapsa sp.]